jgi:hypothetical protein
MLKQSLILGEKAEKDQQTKVKRTKLGGVTSLRNGTVAIAYNKKINVIYFCI